MLTSSVIIQLILLRKTSSIIFPAELQRYKSLTSVVPFTCNKATYRVEGGDEAFRENTLESCRTVRRQNNSRFVKFTDKKEPL